MREFETIFREGLKRGLRKHHDNPRNAEALVECHNAKPSPGGLVPITIITNPIDATMSWPYPQLFPGMGRRDTFGCTLGSVIDTLEFAPDVSATVPVACHVYGDVYAVAFADSTTSFSLTTLSITPAGVIADAVLDTWQFQTGGSSAASVSIAKLHPTLFLITYEGPGYDGHMITVTISNAGAITKTAVDSCEFDNDTGTPGTNILTVGPSCYAFVFSGSSSYGFVRSYRITTDGDLPATNAYTDSLAFDTSRCDVRASFVHISGAIYAVAYEGPDDDGWVKTFSISSTGNISAAIIDSLEFDSATGVLPQMTHVFGDYYAIAYVGAGTDGFLKIVRISSNGLIGATVVDSLEFDAVTCDYPSIHKVADRQVVVAHSTTDSVGALNTFQLNADGTITDDAAQSTATYDATRGKFSWLVELSHGYFAVFYQGVDNDGFVKTFSIS